MSVNYLNEKTADKIVQTAWYIVSTLSSIACRPDCDECRKIMIDQALPCPLIQKHLRIKPQLRMSTNYSTRIPFLMLQWFCFMKKCNSFSSSSRTCARLGNSASRCSPHIRRSGSYYNGVHFKVLQVSKPIMDASSQQIEYNSCGVLGQSCSSSYTSWTRVIWNCLLPTDQ